MGLDMQSAGAVVVGALVLVLITVVLGTLREMALFRNELAAFRQIITKPSTPSFIGAALPGPVMSRLREASSEEWSTAPRLLLFLTEGCSGCTDLAEKLRELADEGLIDPSRLAVVVPRPHLESSVSQLASSLRALGSTVLADDDGALFQACEIQATPAVFQIAGDPPRVVDSVFGGDLAWVRRALLTNERQVDLVLTSASTTARL